MNVADESFQTCQANPGCVGAQLEGGHCLEHLTPKELQVVMARVRAGESLDARNTTIPAERLQALLGGLREGERALLATAYFDGASFREHANFRGTTFSGEASFGGASFGGDAYFGEATFSGEASFGEASFGGYASFGGATFGGGAVFAGASFGDYAVFDGATFSGDAGFAPMSFTDEAGFDAGTPGGSAVFDGARFTGDARFGGASFTGDARFPGATFGGSAVFDAASFGGDARFGGASFGGRARFGGASFGGGAVFGRASFGDYAVFGGVSFGGSTVFDGASFGGGAVFGEASFGGDAVFGGASFGAGAGFDATSFGGYAGFGEATFGGDAVFAGARFGGGAGFGGATFGRDAVFGGASFSGDAVFGGATFGGAVSVAHASFKRDATFARSVFERTRELSPFVVSGRLILDDSVFAERVRIEAAARVVSAHAATFAAGALLRLRWAEVALDDADFARPSALLAATTWRAKRDLEAACLVDDRHWELDPRPRLMTLRGAHVAQLSLSNIDLRACRFFGAHGLESLSIEASCEWPRPPTGGRYVNRETIAEEQAWRGWTDPATQPPAWLEARDGAEPLRPAQIAALYRALRKAREEDKDQPGAGDLYYGEMEMRRHARDERHPVRARGETAILQAYWLLSGYGLRPGRALAALAGTLVAGAALLWWFGFHEPRTYGRSVLFAIQSALSVLRPPETGLSAGGEIVQISLRLLGPLLFGLWLLAVRARVKR